MTTLLIATRNAHKVEEIRAILSDQFRYLTLRDFPAAPLLWKMRQLLPAMPPKRPFNWLNGLPNLPSPIRQFMCDFPLFALADDSGLEVDALPAHRRCIPPALRPSTQNTRAIPRRCQQRKAPSPYGKCSHRKTRRPVPLCAGVDAGDGASQGECLARLCRERI